MSIDPGDGPRVAEAAPIDASVVQVIYKWLKRRPWPCSRASR
jgi:hypothetical protein